MLRRIVFVCMLSLCLPAFSAQSQLVRPELGRDCQPTWPRTALIGAEEGGVQVSVMVGTDGKAMQVTLEHSSGVPSLDAASVEALKSCTFKRGTLNNQPVQMLLSVFYRWTLSDGRPAGKGWDRIRQLAQEGDISALYSYAFVIGADPNNTATAMALFKHLANSGFVLAQRQLAASYEEGKEVAQDMAQAEFWYAQAARNGDVFAVERARLLNNGKSAPSP